MSIELPSTLTHIGGECFESTMLYLLVIPKSVIRADHGFCDKCNNLSVVKLSQHLYDSLLNHPSYARGVKFEIY